MPEPQEINFDACPDEELRFLLDPRSSPPAEGEDRLDYMQRTEQRCTKEQRAYIRRLLQARAARLSGRIQEALEHEAELERLYRRIAAHLRW